MQTSLFVNFGSGVTKRSVQLNRRRDNARRLLLRGYTCSGVTDTVFMLQIDGFSSVVSNEGATGYPVPLFAAGHLFEVPLYAFDCDRPTVLDLHVQLRALNGSPLTHTGFNLWLELDCTEKAYDLPIVAAEQWVNKLSGVGTNDWRWANVPEGNQAAQAEMQQRFSKLIE